MNGCQLVISIFVNFDAYYLNFNWNKNENICDLKNEPVYEAISRSSPGTQSINYIDMTKFIIILKSFV